MDKRPEGVGRGGRGAIILAQLKNQPRRPGQAAAEAESSKDAPAEKKPLGRAALLQSFVRSQTASDVEVKEPPLLVGRGRGLAIPGLLSGTGRGFPKSEAATSPSVSVASKPPSVEPPTSEVSSSFESSSSLPSQFEKLTIGKYSGTSGTPIKLEVNYVYLKVMKEKGIHEYHVSFSPSVDSKNMKFRLLNQQSVRDVIGSVKTFDGSKLYLPVKLSSATNVTVNMPTDGSVVQITIKYIKICQASDCLHLYNLLFRKIMNILKMTQVGRNYFDPKGCVPVPQHKLEIWPGYVTAVQEYEAGVMLNCDASFRVLRTVTAYELMSESSRQSKSNMKEGVMKALIGAVVLTRYNNKTYRVDDIAWNMNPNSKFACRDGSEISFVDYYKRSYDVQIKDVAQPLLINKAKKNVKETDQEEKLICLIPELCFMTGLTDDMRSDFKVMKDVSSFTRVTPDKRQYALKKFIENINNCPEAKATLTNWNLMIDHNPLSLDGRLLKNEQIFFGRNKSITVGDNADWGRDAMNSNVLVPVDLDKWVIVFTKRDSPRVTDFVKMLHNVCPKLGVQVKDPMRVELNNDRTELYIESLKKSINPSVQIVVIIFPTARDDRYSAVKRLCCLDMPIPSQVINSKTISNATKLRSIVQKIALQMNCKLGGELWSVHIPIKNIMICGLDTYHDTTRTRKSVLAFVASMNENKTRWFSMTTSQSPGQEAGDCLQMLFISSLNKYFEYNHCLPEKIILFRDGVGDGQIDFVAKYEVEQLTLCFKKFTDYSPALSVIVVQKRINTRMYGVTNERGRVVLDNPLPGSVLDHSVTRKKWYDFFLVSQHVRQGTVSPTHYVVIYDTSIMKPEHMQRLSYKMTHLYYNWPGTVRVPAPCQYAHKLAYLVGQNVKKETHPDLSDRLFYL